MNRQEPHRGALDVYLVPLGASEHELYCESPEVHEEETGADADGETEAQPAGRIHRVRRWASRPARRMYRRFRQVLLMVQDERRARRLAADSAHHRGLAGWMARVRDRAIAYIAEAVAEQHLLWRLRREHAALLHHPDDLEGARALAITRQVIKRDADRHSFWLVADGLILIVTGVVAIIPGPNLLAYYFTFRCVGHFLSWRGARHGLSGVNWTTEPSAPLTALRDVSTLEPSRRAERVRDVASRLHLDRLAAFVERTAARSA